LQVISKFIFLGIIFYIFYILYEKSATEVATVFDQEINQQIITREKN